MKIGKYLAKIWTKVCSLLFWATLYIVASHLLRRMFLSFLHSSDSSLKLLVVPKDEDILQMVRTVMQLSFFEVYCS